MQHLQFLYRLLMTLAFVISLIYILYTDTDTDTEKSLFWQQRIL